MSGLPCSFSTEYHIRSLFPTIVAPGFLHVSPTSRFRHCSATLILYTGAPLYYCVQFVLRSTEYTEPAQNHALWLDKRAKPSITTPDLALWETPPTSSNYITEYLFFCPLVDYSHNQTVVYVSEMTASNQINLLCTLRPKPTTASRVSFIPSELSYLRLTHQSNT